jgi:hypothetical protein
MSSNKPRRPGTPAAAGDDFMQFVGALVRTRYALPPTGNDRNGSHPPVSPKRAPRHPALDPNAGAAKKTQR